MPPLSDDAADLPLFAHGGDQQAFSRLVSRHANFVYSACLRQVRNPALAEDAAQAVFILLAQKASSLASQKQLAGWLFNVARHTSRNAIRSEKRRKKYEKEAAVHPHTAAAASTTLNDIEPLLDQALSRLSTTDRDAILLRYFHDQSHEEVAAAMGTNPHTAKMRVLRALEKLRHHLSKLGITTLPGALEAGLIVSAGKTAPAGFVARASGSTQTSTAAAIASTTALMITLQKLATIASIPAIFLIAIATLSIVLQTQPATIARGNPLPATAPATSQPTTQPLWRKEFDRVYTLAPGENLRHIPTPFIRSRADFIREIFDANRSDTVNGRFDDPNSAAANPKSLILEFNPKTNNVDWWRRANSSAWPFGNLLSHLTEIPMSKFIVSPKLNAPIPGDWIWRKRATSEERLLGFQKAMEGTKWAFTIEKKTIQRDIILAKGIFAPDEWPGRKITVRISPDPAEQSAPVSGGDAGYFFRQFPKLLGRPVVNEWKGSDLARMEFDEPSLRLNQLPAEKRTEELTKILKHLSDQLHIEMTLESQPVESYVIEPAPRTQPAPAR